VFLLFLLFLFGQPIQQWNCHGRMRVF
jgi:hypothetical protein